MRRAVDGSAILRFVLVFAPGLQFVLTLNLVSCPINKFTDALEFIEYRVGGGSPNEGPLVGVVMSHVGVDLPHQFPDVAERAAADRLLGDKREPALDLVEPA